MKLRSLARGAAALLALGAVLLASLLALLSGGSNAELELLDAIRSVAAGVPNQPALLVLQGAAHFNFSDQALLAQPQVARTIGLIGAIDAARGLQVTGRFVRAFFDTHLKGTPDRLLEAPGPGYPEIRFP